MPKNNSKKQSIYNPTGGKRLSKKRIYKLLKKDKMNGGGILKELGNFFSGGDPEKINESNSSGIEPTSEEPVPTPSVETSPVEEPVPTPSEETPSEETPSEETPSEEPVETPSEAPESNIDGQGNIKTIDNTLSVSEEQSPSVLDGALAVATTAADSAKNTFNEISDAVTTDVNDNEVGEEEGDDVDVSDNEDDDDDEDDDDENKNKLMEIIADQNKTIDNQNTTIDNLNQTIKEQSDKLVQILEKHITDLKTTDDNTIQYPPVSSPMSPDTMGGKTKGRRSTKKRRSK